MIRNWLVFEFNLRMQSLFQPLTNSPAAKKQECVFLILAGVFLGTLGIINILGLSRFVDLSLSIGDWTFPMILPLGVLPYPITFLCTDLISEFYGKERANLVVWIGLFINLGIVFFLWLGGILPPNDHIDPLTQLPPIAHPEHPFFTIRLLTMGGVIGSMIAYLLAQLLDVYLFHYWKARTKGKHLWLRNNGSTLISQLMDTIIVITLAYWLTDALPLNTEKSVIPQLLTMIFCSYSFKALMALLDTVPFYLIVIGLRRYFGLSSSDLAICPSSPFKFKSFPH